MQSITARLPLPPICAFRCSPSPPVLFLLDVRPDFVPFADELLLGLLTLLASTKRKRRSR